jgi:hypothetical protein
MNPRLPLLLGVALLLGASGPSTKPKPLDPAEAALKGRALAADMIAQRPAQNFTNTGVLKIRDSKRRWTEMPMRITTLAGGTNWSVVYVAGSTTNSAGQQTLTILHEGDGPAAYRTGAEFLARTAPGNELMVPFAGSDFWLVDLGLEFFHWPEQRLLRNELCRSRACHVLESVNPQPAPGAYARVVSWIDHESGGIVHAEAYDAKNKLLKEFDPKDFKKVDGQMQLEEMQIDNYQSNTRTRIEFIFDKK